MTANEVRQRYLDFFTERGHSIIPSASLIPENDPTVLFTTAGMHPLVPFLLGEKHPAGERLVNYQKCVRTGDIEEVGDTTHHTFFEMLGNWSLGNYFKKDAIEWSWEFLTSDNWLGLDKNRIAVSVFVGDQDAPFDEEAYNIWKEIFEKNNLPIARIAKLPKDNNWWGLSTGGPCGPDTEMFYWIDSESTPDSFNDDNKFWVEIWNDVFMQLNQETNGHLNPLKQKNVDTGMGLERILAVVNKLDDDYRTELFWSIILKLQELSGEIYGNSIENTRAMRIIADHVKAAVFILVEGLEPSNTERGYVLRRLIRRAVRYGKQLGIRDVFAHKLLDPIIEIYKETYPELQKNKDFIEEQLKREEERFQQVIQDGLKKAEKIIASKEPVNDEIFKKMTTSPVKEKREAFKKLYKEGINIFGIQIPVKEILAATINGKEAFDLYQTYGFPIELIVELAQEKNLFVDKDDFREELKKHQEISKNGSEQKFKGGLADTSEQTIKYHTAAHLMLSALRKVLGEDVIQKGSNITAERLRFDFSHPDKMTSEQIKQTENLVNEQIQKNLPVICNEMNLKEAKKVGATGVFESKYGDKVKVYSIGDISVDSEPAFSLEICGGPHVSNTGELGHFKILKEEASSAGVRRIKAVLE